MMSSDSSFFVTSTGTDIGKTVASRLFVTNLQSRDLSLSYYKPVASGCLQSEWGYRSPDEVEVIEETSLSTDDVRATYRFGAPLSPDRAATRENEHIELKEVLDHWEQLRGGYDRVVVEGIGGVAVPFNRNEDVADLISMMSLPVLLVVQSSLGTISYTRTAVEYLRERGNEIRGILLTPEEGREIERINHDHLSFLFPSVNIELLPSIMDNGGNDMALERSRNFLEDCGFL